MKSNLLHSDCELLQPPMTITLYTSAVEHACGGFIKTIGMSSDVGRGISWTT